MIKISPSILSADFANLERDISLVENLGADLIHVDVMDGSFVPNITIGIPVVKSIRRVTGLPLDVHLMIDRPVRYIDDFADAGADIITVHLESDKNEEIKEAVALIKNKGKRAGLSIKPGTDASEITDFLPNLDLILIMTVEPGFGGQRFMSDMLGKIKAVKDMRDRVSPACEIEVDGGINPDNAKLVIEAGADILVVGSALFGAKDMPSVMNSLKKGGL